MATIPPDIIARVRLFTQQENGRLNPLPPRPFGCPFFYQGEGFDCRLLLAQTGTTLVPGETAEIAVKFLNPDLIKPRLNAGDQFKLWDGKDFAVGEVLEVRR